MTGPLGGSRTRNAACQGGRRGNQGPAKSRGAVPKHDRTRPVGLVAGAKSNRSRSSCTNRTSSSKARSRAAIRAKRLGNCSGLSIVRDVISFSSRLAILAPLPTRLYVLASHLRSRSPIHPNGRLVFAPPSSTLAWAPPRPRAQLTAVPVTSACKSISRHAREPAAASEINPNHD